MIANRLNLDSEWLNRQRDDTTVVDEPVLLVEIPHDDADVSYGELQVVWWDPGRLSELRNSVVSMRRM